MFDTISGLPVHALVVHAVVVGLPLMAVLSVLIAARPGWRSWLPLAVAGNVVVVGLAVLARQSGQLLQARLSGLTGSTVAADHARLGTWLWAPAAALLIAAVLAWWAARSGRGIGLAVALVTLTAIAAVGGTAVVGDSGARAVWEQTIQHTTAP
jgi:hypothetical protein